MRQSHFFGKTKREISKEEESINAQILLRGGYIYKTMSGVYSYLPLGLRVLQRITAIVREEMNKLPGVQEVLMPVLQPRELWDESGRWSDAKADVMYSLEEDSICLGPTHEEIATDLFRHFASSYKDLPVAIYQIQSKFRREARAKSGLLRGREFLMKDLYSFHLTEEDLDAFYATVQEAYVAVYQRCGLDAVLTRAAGGMFSKYSHEYQVFSPAGEDTIYLKDGEDFATNQEIMSEEDMVAFTEGRIPGRYGAATEVGNIFKMKYKVTEPMQATVVDEKGEEVVAFMGCYGIGISRLMGTIVEIKGSSDKMVWPKSVAPFAVHLLDLTPDHQADRLYNDLVSVGKDVLYDDREVSAGEKFADADLIGVPTRVIFSKRSLEAGGAELIDLTSGESKIVALADLGAILP